MILKSVKNALFIAHVQLAPMVLDLFQMMMVVTRKYHKQVMLLLVTMLKLAQIQQLIEQL